MKLRKIQIYTVTMKNVQKLEKEFSNRKTIRYEYLNLWRSMSNQRCSKKSPTRVKNRPSEQIQKLRPIVSILIVGLSKKNDWNVWTGTIRDIAE